MSLLLIKKSPTHSGKISYKLKSTRPSALSSTHPKIIKIKIKKSKNRKMKICEKKFENRKNRKIEK